MTTKQDSTPVGVPCSAGLGLERPKWHPGEREAAAIKEAKRLVGEAQRKGREVQDAIQALAVKLDTIQATDRAPELKKLQARCDDLNRLCNAMELGSFMIQVSHAMDSAWQRLP